MFHCVALHFKGEIKEKDAQWVIGRCSAVFKCFGGVDAFIQIREQAKKNHCMKKAGSILMLSLLLLSSCIYFSSGVVAE